MSVYTWVSSRDETSRISSLDEIYFERKPLIEYDENNKISHFSQLLKSEVPIDIWQALPYIYDRAFSKK